MQTLLYTLLLIYKVLFDEVQRLAVCCDNCDALMFYFTIRLRSAACPTAGFHRAIKRVCVTKHFFFICVNDT